MFDYLLVFLYFTKRTSYSKLEIIVIIIVIKITILTRRFIIFAKINAQYNALKIYLYIILIVYIHVKGVW